MLYRLDAESLQAFPDGLHLPLHDLAEAEHLFGCDAHETRAATGHGLVEEDRGLTDLALTIGPFHLLLKLGDAFLEEVLMACLLAPLLEPRRGLVAGDQVPGLLNGGPNLRLHIFLAVHQEAHLDAAERSQLARLLYQALASPIERCTTARVVSDPLEAHLLATHGDKRGKRNCLISMADEDGRNGTYIVENLSRRA
ncbi:hypothetical protein PR202_gb20410 [Eleusine coracana subsp. coracana]|uniref:Uncharacterized protein n=1 Tax=Eleusine coracana subsp. coracana TaxID=191504 RepID=A0AAV5FAL9_ELECO|nr:hypothetical protein PR202_gb20410 [Eleusine coracana subsp. coracana]